MYDKPMTFLLAELDGLYGSAVLEDIGKTIRLYDFYDGRGQDWKVASGLDYKPAKKKVNLVKKLIKREAGFMFGRTPEINLKSDALNASKTASAQQWLDGVLENSGFKNKLIQAARDCFIGRRVAVKISGGFGRERRVTCRPSFEFVYSTVDDDCDTLSKMRPNVRISASGNRSILCGRAGVFLTRESTMALVRSSRAETTLTPDWISFPAA